MIRITVRDAYTGMPPEPSDLEEALRRTESRFDWLMARAGYGLCAFASTGQILAANQAFAEMLGYVEPEEVAQLLLGRDIVIEEGGFEGFLRAAESTGEWVTRRWRRQDGAPITLRATVMPLQESSGPAVFEAFVEDVTERQRQDEILRRTERMASLGTTLAGVAHELNNPLAAIMGFVQLLLKKTWPADDRMALETVNHEAIRAASIVRDLLAIARRRDVARRAATDLNEVLAYVVRTRRYGLETTGIECRIELASELPPAHADRAQLEQVILNLLSNAEDALRPDAEHESAHDGQGAHPTIILRTLRGDDCVVIEVEDNGPGIAPNLESQIWDPFWTTKAEGEGAGLGLAVAHAIVTEHGGTITAEPAGGRGARFVVRLPISNEARAGQGAVQASRALDVLIVDPGASDLMFVERYLTRRGHAVINAGSGELAQRLAQHSAFDAVVCDSRLRNRDGVLLAEALYGAPGCARARFILSAGEAVNVSSLPAGLRHAPAIMRPYEVEELRRLIEGE